MDINKFLSKIFGSKANRDMKEIQPWVEKIKAAHLDIQTLDNNALRAKTRELQQNIQNSAAELNEKIAELKNKIEETPIEDRAIIFNQIDKLEKEVLERMDVALEEALPEAFAIVKETARRFTENETLLVDATDYDRELAVTKDFVEISEDGEHAIYHNHWTAGGNDLKWEMIHYDVQLFGGVVLTQGKIAEMATGEGKTLVATCPVFLRALAGRGVHVVTVNDYLAKRDSEWMGPLYQFHGLSVDCIDKHQPNSEARRRAYNADITFGTNNEFGFDYLRDNMAMKPADLVQRKHYYAIVDEVDSVLIDDARTPLIISGPVEKGEDQMYEQYQPLVERLVAVQRKYATEQLTEAKRLIASNNKEDQEKGYLALYRSHKALPKNGPLIKFLSEPGIKAGMLKTEEIYMENNNRRMPEAVEPLYFVVDEKQRSCDLTDKGTAWLANEVKNDELFVLPDIAGQLSALEAQKLPDEERVAKKDELLSEYAIKADRVHTLQQLLKAYSMFTLNDDYVIQDGQVKIVDESTGRIMEGRRWSDGLHQAVEAKEHVKVEAATQTFATITLQNYFRMYHKLAGMTGTAITEAGEFWNIYKLDVVEIPTNRPIQRNDMNDRVYKTQREKYNAVIEEIVKMRNAGRPTLVGTSSVEISELLSRLLDLRRIPHQVLNAKLHQKEADIVAMAGQSTPGKIVETDEYGEKIEREGLLGAVTIATNMAGRGTDIKLSEEVRAAGGLAIIGTERHDSRRVDRQLRGRAGRQGDVGSSVFYVSLEDKLMRLFASERIASMMDKLGFKDGEMIESGMINKSIERAQKKVEENNFGTRKHLLEYDDVMNKQRTVIYEKRRHALMGERIGMDISNMIWDRVIDIIDHCDYPGCVDRFIEIFAMQVPFTEEEYNSAKREDLYEQAFDAAITTFRRKTEAMREVAVPVIKQVYETQSEQFDNILVPITDGKLVFNIRVSLKEAYETECRNVVREFEKTILLHNIDDSWKENLRLLDELKHSVRNVSYEQKDPLVVFKIESVKLFDDMVNDINNNSVATLMRARIPVAAPEEVQQAAPEPDQQTRYTESKQELDSAGNSIDGGDSDMAAAAQQDTHSRQPQQPIVKNKLPNRNDPCPCGSGKKFKQCHGKGIV
ncbi:preprotein translocase subunit SecA [Alloprevotella sp. OH1205_COT-284]|uniref:preprotein translocase subunit SecA n=1 Tax=Alloprevotella sp. OH1205_COT-284 TaxID=2491043 RepID=UPI000F5F5C7D|nr:preprotein translocase subunit SecA [Alloprevotella sp. OH1205_COT-284]RRD79912.1 preprotein translocase subunit SecA [Alloprevotella sp. OH1205_COT-284]